MRVRKVFVALLIACSGPTFAENLPHYFPVGVEKTNHPALQLRSYFRDLNSLSQCTQPGDTMPIIDEMSISVLRVVEGKKVKFVFAPYTRTSDKRIIFSTFCSADRTFVTQEQFDFAAEDTIREAVRAMEELYKYFEKYEKLAVEARAKSISMSVDELRKQLPLPVPGAPQVTYRERYQLPVVVNKTDFIPNEVHVSFIPALGIAYLNSGVVYTSLQSRITDYVSGYPKVMMHEFVHANPNLQNLVLNSGIDLELMASVPEMLMEDNKIDLFFHGYAGEIRELIRIYFGFNFKHAREEIIKFDPAGHLIINAVKLVEYQNLLEKAKKDLHVFFRDVVVPEFYSDPVYWTSQHDKLQDSRGVFHIMMALHYDPTILGSSGETRKFLEAHSEEFKRMAEEAYRESGNNVASGSNGGWSWPVPKLFVQQLQSSFGITPERAAELGQKYGITAEDIKNKSLPELFRLANRILKQELKSRGEEVR